MRDTFKGVIKSLQEVAKMENNKRVYDEIQEMLDNWDEFKAKVNNHPITEDKEDSGYETEDEDEDEED